MRVLLISPLRGLEPPCGDPVYTAAHLGNPPDCVEYENYANALLCGDCPASAATLEGKAARAVYGLSWIKSRPKLVQMARKYLSRRRNTGPTKWCPPRRRSETSHTRTPAEARPPSGPPTTAT